MRQIALDAEISETHAAIERARKLDSLISNQTHFTINLRNRKYEIIGKAIVDKDVYVHIINSDVIAGGCLISGGYAAICVSKKVRMLHKYIYHDFHKHEKIKNYVIDHINSNKLDNRIENLRQVTILENAQNKSKKANASSNYIGVSLTKENTWKCQVIDRGIKHQYFYKTASHAAYHRDLLVCELGLSSKLNNIEMPADFVKSKRQINRGINHLKNNKFSYTFQHKKYGEFDTLEDARNARNVKVKEYYQARKTERMNNIGPIERNSDGVAIIKCTSPNKEKVDVLIDDDDYSKIKPLSWSLTNGYPHTQMSGKSVRLSRFIMCCTDIDKFVDHIDRNPLNNQRLNLRIVTPKENCQNKSSAKNSKSKYVGVSYDNAKRKWVAYITMDGVFEQLGSFATEDDAVRARDKRANELNKLYNTIYDINFKEECDEPSQEDSLSEESQSEDDLSEYEKCFFDDENCDDFSGQEEDDQKS